MPLRRDDAVVLARYPFRERDLVVVLLTRAGGQVRVVAHRSRGIHSRSASALEPLARVRVSYFESARSELMRLDEVTLERSSFAIASRPRAWAAGHVVAELALAFSPPGERQETMFRLVDRCVSALAEGIDPAQVVSYADLWFLRLGGVLPDMARCGACGALLAEADRVFDPAESRFVCGEHRPARVVRLEEQAMAWVARALAVAVERVGGPPPESAAAWLDSLIRDHAEKALPGRRTWAEISRDPRTV